MIFKTILVIFCKNGYYLKYNAILATCYKQNLTSKFYLHKLIIVMIILLREFLKIL